MLQPLRDVLHLSVVTIKEVVPRQSHESAGRGGPRLAAAEAAAAAEGNQDTIPEER